MEHSGNRASDLNVARFRELMIRNSLISLSYTMAEAVLRACAIGSADDPAGVKRPDNAHAVRQNKTRTVV
jgi:hypothetical protein